jgi:hypothetical protein
MYVGLLGICGQGFFEFQSFSDRGLSEVVDGHSVVSATATTPRRNSVDLGNRPMRTGSRSVNSGADCYSSRLTSAADCLGRVSASWSLSLFGGRSALWSHKRLLVMHSGLLLNADRNSCAVCPAPAGSRHGHRITAFRSSTAATAPTASANHQDCQ